MSRPATAVVTGAAQGIGAALARHAAGLGMAVAAADRDAEGLDRLRVELESAGGRVVTRALDVSQREQMALLAADCADMPPVTRLFANAGVLRGAGVLDMPLADWSLLFAVNVIGVVATLQAIVPVMQTHGFGGHIVVTGSTGTMSCAPGLAAYCGTKHALWPIVEALRQELQDTRLGVSLLMPGAVATAMFDAIDPDRVPPADALSPEAIAEMAFAGAEQDRAKILTHPAYVARFRDRFDSVLRELT